MNKDALASCPRPWRLSFDEVNDEATVLDASGTAVPVLTDIPLGWTDTTTGNYHSPETDVAILQAIVEAVNRLPRTSHLRGEGHHRPLKARKG